MDKNESDEKVFLRQLPHSMKELPEQEPQVHSCLLAALLCLPVALLLWLTILTHTQIIMAMI